jgi:hypothetical protein
MYAFIYRLYRPEHLADPSYVATKPDVPHSSVDYTIRISPRQADTIDYEFFPWSASDPFRTHTHVLAIPSTSKIKNPVFEVIKEQLCRRDSRFDERSILNHIHQPVKVPGVVEAVHSEVIEMPLSGGRQKLRLGLRPFGDSFQRIPTVRMMLETLFDILEGDSDSID